MKIKITKSYKALTIFEDLELNLKENLIHVVIGPSGCGKTTLLRCIADLCDYHGTIEQTHQSIGYVFQDDRLFPYLKVINNLLVINKDVEKINSLLLAFDIYDLKDKYPHQISGGEKQRVSIIRALLGDNTIILMDEPFKSLDFHLKLSLIEIIYKIQKETNKMMILVTHDLDVALYLGNYIHVLSEKPTFVKESIYNPYVKQDLNEESVILHNKLKNLMI